VKRDLLAFLSSPCCRAAMKFDTLKQFPALDSSELDEGLLSCAKCGRQYPFAGRVPELVAGPVGQKAAKTRDSFALEWQRYPQETRPEDRPVFLEECQLSPGDFQGKVVLDAGCGMGRYSVVALGLGAEVVAMDLSESLRGLAAKADRLPKLHVLKGDLLNPPLREKAFDIVYSHGVLHHTSDTRAAFDAVAKLVRPGGYLSVWLYGKAGRFSDFADNPIREDRPWVRRHRRLAWLVVGLRHAISDFLRFFTTRLPLELVYAVCWPLAALGAVPFVKYLTFSVHPDFQVRLIENFDWLSPPYQFHHTKEELARWFREAGFDVIKILPHGLVPKPGILGRRRG